jgi:RNA polymerase sigma factor (sigma-70 family)
MKDYRLTVKVRNNRILKAIEASGGSPGGKWCEANGLCYAEVNDLINMTAGPLKASGAMRDVALRLCEAVDKLPEDLWSNAQLYPLEKNFSEMEMDHEQLLALLPAEEQSYLPDHSNIEQEQVRKVLDSALATLTPGQRSVLAMRNDAGLTLDQCAEKLGVSKERVRQVEQKALRAMRQLARVGLLADAMDPDDLRGYDMKACKDAAAKLKASA